MATENGEQMNRYAHLPTMGPRPDDTTAQWSSESWGNVWNADGYNADKPVWRAATPPDKVQVDPIEPEDIEEVTHFWAVAYEEYADQTMQAVMRLKDGRWASVDTWSDSSGYGCQDGTTWHIGATFDDVARWGLTDEARKHLSIEQPV